jgi:hypothetical protein
VLRKTTTRTTLNRMRIARRLVPLSVLAVLLMAAAVPAQAKLKATSTLVTTAGKTRLSVKLTSTKKLSARTKPRKVSAKTGKTKIKLKKVKGSSAAVNAGTWRSAALSSTKLANLNAKVGKRLTIRVLTRSGKTTLKPKLTVEQTGGGGGGGGSTGTLFAPPSMELVGEAAFNHFSRYFINSRFTDCVAGWPNCAVEERYNHCDAQGSWEYHRYTPTSGSDINSVGSLQVIGARAHLDGSWMVEYSVDAYSQTSYYHWDVSKAGNVTGRYWAPGADPQGPASQALGPLVWAQPARCGQI